MKTVCPHCNEEYEVPDNYLQQEAECAMCSKTFTITQAKNCPKCGTPNSMQASSCWSCQAPFNPITPVPEKEKTPEPKKRSSSADSLGTFTYICFWIFALCYVGAAYGIIGSCIWILGRCFSLNFWLFIVSIFLIIFEVILIVTFYVIVSMTTMVTKSHIKVYLQLAPGYGRSQRISQEKLFCFSFGLYIIHSFPNEKIISKSISKNI